MDSKSMKAPAYEHPPIYEESEKTKAEMEDANSEDSSAGGEPDSKEEKNSTKKYHKLPRSRGAKRRTRQRHRRNQNAINFLKRFAIVVVLVDLSSAICESNLISTFLLFLTLSSTFDAKPENVIDSYCYYQPSGNRMCEDYMERVTGYSVMSHRQYATSNGNVGSSTNTPTANHFPSIPTKPPLTEEESYQLFLVYNQSLYDTPARFKMQQNIIDNCMSAKLYSQMAQRVFENYTGTHLPPHDFDEVTQKMSHLYSNVRVSKLLTIPSAPLTLRKDIPQVTHAMEKGLEKRKNPEGLDFKAFKEKLHHSETNQSIIILNQKLKNLIQVKDFIRHRWKRSAAANPSTTSTTVETKDSAREPQPSAATQQKSKGKVVSFNEKTNATQYPINAANMFSEQDEQVAVQNKTDANEAALVKPESKNQDSQKISNEERAKEKVLDHKNTGSKLPSRQTVNVPIADEAVITNSEKKSQLNGKEYVESLGISPASFQSESVNTCKHSSKDREYSFFNWKTYLKIHTVFDESPRNFLTLIESSLFNNWKCFLESARHYMTPKSQTEAPPPGCWFHRDTELEKVFKALSHNISLSMPMLGMDMDLFSPETLKKAEMRKRAMAQIYHDYGSSIMGQMTSFSEMPISRTLVAVTWTVKTYALTWHVVICCILLYGSIFEDKTALHIWGILNILTSLIHFMIEDWINSTFHPEKSAMAIWCFVIYGLYKPMTILLVGTLASEILKKNGLLKSKGAFSKLWNTIWCRKQPPPTKKRGERSQLAAEKFFLTTGILNDGQNLDNSCVELTCPILKTSMKVSKTTMDDEGNLYLVVRSPPSEITESGPVCVCSGKGPSSVIKLKGRVIGLRRTSLEEENGKPKKIVRRSLFFKRSPVTGKLLSEEELLYSNDEDEEENETEVVVDSSEDDDDDDDDDDEDDMEVNQGDHPPSGRRETKQQKRQRNDHSSKVDDGKYYYRFHPELHSRIDFVLEKGPNKNENGKASELPYGSPPPPYFTDPNQFLSQVTEDLLKNAPVRDQNDVAYGKPDRTDGNCIAPVLDGENPHI